LEDFKKSLAEQLVMNTIEKGRENLLIVGGALVLEAMKIFECNLLIVREHGLREGVVLNISS
jgi:exopolyphosphatase/pppGpp-phosphohydrolase